MAERPANQARPFHPHKQERGSHEAQRNANRRRSQVAWSCVLVGDDAQQFAAVWCAARRRPKLKDDGPNNQVDQRCCQKPNKYHLNDAPHEPSYCTRVCVVDGSSPPGIQKRLGTDWVLKSTVMVLKARFCGRASDLLQHVVIVGRERRISRVLFSLIRNDRFEYRTTSNDTMRHDAVGY
jgi:hypothetical protein